MPSQFVANAWAKFEAEGVPKGASDTQRREMKRAFYGGGMAVLGTFLKHLSDEEESDDVSEADQLIVSDVHDELLAFTILVKMGLA